MHGRTEDARLLDLRHAVEDAHRVHRTIDPELENRTCAEDFFELADRAERGETPRLDDGDPMAVLRLVQVMRRHQDGDAVGGKPFDETPEVAA
jgi:hypothetical protein